jgi:hypothetical protein
MSHQDSSGNVVAIPLPRCAFRLWEAFDITKWTRFDSVLRRGRLRTTLDDAWPFKEWPLPLDFGRSGRLGRLLFF